MDETPMSRMTPSSFSPANSVQSAETAIDEAKLVFVLALERLPGRDRVGIAVDRDDAGARRKQQARIAAGAKRAVDDDGARTHIERRDRFARHHRQMARGLFPARGLNHSRASWRCPPGAVFALRLAISWRRGKAAARSFYAKAKRPWRGWDGFRLTRLRIAAIPFIWARYG